MSERQLSVMRPSSSLGVTALLDELLSEGHGKSEPAAAPPSLREMPDSPGICAATPEADSPRSKQIAELCGEMDLCLASLGKWEEESRLRVEALRKDLEAQYGFPYEEDIRFANFDSQDDEGEQPPEFRHPRGPDSDEEDEPEVELIAASVRQAAPRGPSRPEQASVRMAASALRTPGWQPSPRISQLKAQEDAMRQVDEERIARLRAEVGMLRQKEADMQQDMVQHWLDVEALEGSAPGASDLSAWCTEVDGVLGDCTGALTGGRPGLPDGPGDEEGAEARHLEIRLAEAQCNLLQMEGALDSARSRVDSEIAELELMLNERDRDLADAGWGRGLP